MGQLGLETLVPPVDPHLVLLQVSLRGILLLAGLALPGLLRSRDGGLRFVVVAVVLFKVLDCVLDIECRSRVFGIWIRVKFCQKLKVIRNSKQTGGNRSTNSKSSTDESIPGGCPR